MIYGNSGEDGLNKNDPARSGDMSALPRGELASHLILEVLKMNPLETPNGQRQPKVSHRERGANSRESLKNIIKINIAAMNRGHKAFGAVSDEAGDFPKGGQGGCKELNVFLDRLDKYGRVVGI